MLQMYISDPSGDCSDPTFKGALLFKNRFFGVFCFLIDLDQQFNADSKYVIIFLKFQLIAS